MNMFGSSFERMCVYAAPTGKEGGAANLKVLEQPIIDGQKPYIKVNALERLSKLAPTSLPPIPELRRIQAEIQTVIEDDTSATEDDKYVGKQLISKLEQLINLPSGNRGVGQAQKVENPPGSPIPPEPPQSPPRQPELPVSPETVGPRNDFEALLIAYGFPERSLADHSEAGWELRRSYYWTLLAHQAVVVGGSFTGRKLVPIAEMQFLLRNQEVKVMSLASAADQNIPNAAERDVATRVKDKLVLDVALYETVVTGHNKYLTAGLSGLDALADNFNIGKLSEQPTWLNWLWEQLDVFPTLCVDRGTTERDNIPTAEKILKASKKIVLNGRRKKADGNLETDPFIWQAQIPDVHFNIVSWKDAAGDHSRPRKLRGNPADSSGAIYPYINQQHSELVRRRFNSLAVDSSYKLQNGEADLIGQFVALFSEHLLKFLNLEDAVEDCWPSPKSPQGRPIGANFMSRVIHPPEYNSKLVLDPDDQEGVQNRHLVGTVKTLARGLLDNINWKGKTATQHLVDPGTVQWVDDSAHGKPGVINREFFPAELNRNWATMVHRGVLIYQALTEGLRAKFHDIAQFKIEEGKVIVNAKAVETMLSFFRLATEYHTFTEASPALAIRGPGLEDIPANKTSREAESRELEEQLSSDYYIFEIRNRDNVVISKDFRLVTRFFSNYEASMQDFLQWIQYGDEVRREGLLDKGTTLLPVNKYGVQRKVYWIKLNVKNPNDVIINNDKEVSEQEEAMEFAKNNSPKKLIARYIVSHFFTIIARHQKESRTLAKQDYMAILSLLSAQYRESYEQGGQRGPAIQLWAKLGKMMNVRALQVEPLDIIGPDLFTINQAYQLLAAMGVEVTLEEFREAMNNMFAIAGGKKG